MRGARRRAVLLGGAVAITLATSAIKGWRMEVQDWDCPPTGSCARPVRVSGFPLRYITDYHGISAVGDANVVSALLGDDIMHWAAFGANVAIWAGVLGAGGWVAGRVRRRRGERTGGSGPVGGE